MLTGKKILVGVTGSIAAYKSAYLVRELIRLGAEVRCILTPAARRIYYTINLSNAFQKYGIG